MAYPRRLRAAPRRIPPTFRRVALSSPGATNHTRTPSDDLGLSDSLVIDRETVLNESEGLTDSLGVTTSAFKSASTLSEFSATSGTVTIQSGIVSGDTGILVVAGSVTTTNETPVTVTPSKTGLTFTRITTTPDFPETDDNMWSDAFIVSGLSAADIAGTIDLSLSASRPTSAQLLVYEGSFDPASAMGERSGTTADVTAPDMTCVAGQTIVVIAVDRSPAGVGYNSLSNSNGRTTNVRSYSEAGVTGGSVSILAADFIETGTTTGTTTVTYNHTSANAQALHIPVHIDVRDQSQTDNEGLSDTPAITQDKQRDESIGLTDSLVFNRQTVITESTGLVDILAVPIDLVITDEIFTTDTDEIESIDVEETIDTDAVGITDSFTFQTGLGVSQPENVDLTDSTVIDRASVLPESEGLTDTALVSLVWARSQTDSEGLTDSVSIARDYARSAADSEGLTDSLVFNLAQVTTDTATLADAITVEVTAAGSASYTDTVDLSDSAVIDRSSVTTDTSGVTDALLIEVLSVFEDVVGTTDAIAIAADFQRVLEETSGLTDSVGLLATYDPTIEDDAGISDALTLTMGLPRDINVTAQLLPNARSGALLTVTRKGEIQR